MGSWPPSGQGQCRAWGASKEVGGLADAGPGAHGACRRGHRRPLSPLHALFLDARSSPVEGSEPLLSPRRSGKGAGCQKSSPPRASPTPQVVPSQSRLSRARAPCVFLRRSQLSRGFSETFLFPNCCNVFRGLENSLGLRKQVSVAPSLSLSGGGARLRGKWGGGSPPPPPRRTGRWGAAGGAGCSVAVPPFRAGAASPPAPAGLPQPLRRA